MITTINITKAALKDLHRTPIYIQQKFRAWLEAVNKSGLIETRKHPGWHDEPLQGNRKGQRSIRLNKQWRAIYLLKEDGAIEFVEIIEITSHDY